MAKKRRKPIPHYHEGTVARKSSGVGFVVFALLVGLGVGAASLYWDRAVDEAEVGARNIASKAGVSLP